MSSKELFEFQQTILRDEVEYLHERIAHYDELSFKIKGWTITLWSAVITVGVSEGKPSILLVTIPIVVGFWTLDSYFKKYQRRFRTRMMVIEMFLHSKGPFSQNGLTNAFNTNNFGAFPIHDPISRQSKALHKSVNEYYYDSSHFLRTSFTPSVFLVYAILVFAAIAGFLLLLL